MKVIAKCHNYTGCVRSYRGDKIELESGAPLVCPECGKAVVVTKGENSWMKTTLLLSLGVVLLGGVLAIFVYPLMKGGNDEKPPATPVPGPTAKATPKPDSGKEATPAPPPEKAVAAPIDLDVKSAENNSTRLEVLTRIDLMPNISAGNRERLYLSVDRARKMGKIVTVPFGSGGSTVNSADAEILKATLESPEVQKMRDDPTLVFVILGYADSKGDDKKNLAISQARADSVYAVMKGKCGVQNVMHAVAMGSSKLLDAQSLEKNRIVEVWAVLP
jgi:outer membrane protein OmpA-like peptidoglycan-associated protein